MRLSPPDFWALTPAEWRWLATPAPARGALHRHDLDALMRAFPDDTP